MLSPSACRFIPSVASLFRSVCYRRLCFIPPSAITVLKVPTFGLHILSDDHCISFLDLWPRLLIFRLIFISRCRVQLDLHSMQSIHQFSFWVFGFPPDVFFRLIFTFQSEVLSFSHDSPSSTQSSFSVFEFPHYASLQLIFTFQCGLYFLFHGSLSINQSNFSFFEFLPDVWLSFLRWAFPPILGRHPQSFRPYFVLPMLLWRTGPRYLKLPMIGSVRFSCPFHRNLG